MKVIIITEGYQSTGYGHITRCLSLYQAFQENNIIPTLMVNGDKEAEHFLADSNYELFNWLDYPEILLAKIGSPDIVIVDSYKTDEKFYSELFTRTRLLVAIDDNMRLNYKAHIIVNGTIDSENYDYKKEDKVEHLLGAEYIPLRKEFWNPEEKAINAEIKNVLITLGGQDIRNLTQPILDYFLDHAPYLNYYVVAKENFKIDFKKHTSRGKVEFIFDADALKMKELMLNCDIAVSAAGQTIYELARTGTPAIAVIVADNQIKNVQGWIKNGFITEELYWNDSNLLENICLGISKLKDPAIRERISFLGRNTIKGDGAVKIVSHLCGLVSEDVSFHFLKAGPEQAKIVFDLSNDPVVRANSINVNEILWSDHVGWYEKKINDKNHIFLLCFTSLNEFIGQVRFNLGIDKPNVSISIVEKFRGKGLSYKILKSACKEVFSNHPDLNSLYAYIKPDNIPSINSFIKAGFQYSVLEQINGEMFNLYILGR